MYRDYINQLEENTEMVNQNDDLVILEMKWMGVYDFFHEHLARAQNTLNVKEEGRVQNFLVYVAWLDRLFFFQYYWGFRDPDENGYSSRNVKFSEEDWQRIRDLSGLNEYLVIEGELPIFRDYHAANKELGGFDTRKYNPRLRSFSNFDDFRQAVAKWYKRWQQ